ncbi:hypothetical protein NPIL_674341 [Nephila pilipes]|uniref:Uncharacterized protein n=1 Tax=Nephila pilipes TaxID=299642 RepID=A0A8X6PD51_NEPPI|nr:hypothetical protein NPIL_674341 [Nephila pilipes]
MFCGLIECRSSSRILLLRVQHSVWEVGEDGSIILKESALMESECCFKIIHVSFVRSSSENEGSMANISPKNSEVTCLKGGPEWLGERSFLERTRNPYLGGTNPHGRLPELMVSREMI